MKLIKLFKSIDWFALIVAVCIFIGMKPYFMWNASYLFGWLLNIVSILIFFLKARFRDSKLTPLLVFWFGIFLVLMLGSDIGVARGMITPIALLLFVPFMNKEFASHVFHYFSCILGLILGISVVVWFFYLSGSISPIDSITPINSVKNFTYQVYPLLVVPGQGLAFIRFCGPFDEPGVIGTICLMTLYVSGFNIKKWYTWVFVIAGVCSFSLMFFVGVVVYLLLQLFHSGNKRILFISFIAISIFYLSTKDNDVFKVLIYDRMAWNSDKMELAGEDRASESLIKYFDGIRGSSTYFWGTSNRQCPPSFDGTWGYRNAIIMYGIVFFGGFILFFFLLSLYHKLTRRMILLTMALIVMIVYQRPNIFELNQAFLYSYIVISNSRLSIISKDKGVLPKTDKV